MSAYKMSPPKAAAAAASAVEYAARRASIARHCHRFPAGIRKSVATRHPFRSRRPSIRDHRIIRSHREGEREEEREEKEYEYA